MLNKIFLSFLTVIITAPILTPAVLAASDIVKPKPVSISSKPKQDENLSKAEQAALVKIIQDSVKNGNVPGRFVGGKYVKETSGLYGSLVQELAELGQSTKAVNISIQGLGFNPSGGRKQAKIDVTFEGRRLRRYSASPTWEKTGLHLVMELEKFEDGRWGIYKSRDITVASSGSTTTSSSAANIPSQPIRPADRKMFQQVFTKHLQALNQENLGNYLATLDLKSPNYPAAKKSTVKLFKDYDLKYELKSIDVVSMGKQDAVVKLTATVKKLKGGEFTDSQMVTTNTVIKTNGQWRIYDTQVENISSLNVQPTKVGKR